MELSQGSPWVDRNHCEKEIAGVKWISRTLINVLWGYCIDLITGEKDGWTAIPGKRN